MGTRNLTAVMVDREYKVAQYGQWDGYPSGQGTTILGFLLGEGNIAKLKEAVREKVRFLDPEGRDKEFAEAYDKNAPNWSNDPDNRTAEQKRWFRQYISRDIAGEILANIADSENAEIILRNSIDFAKNGIGCEWSYVVDLDQMTLEVYDGGFDPDNRTGAAAEWKLDNLPTEKAFLAKLEPAEED